METGLILILGGLSLINAFWWYAMWQERLRLERIILAELEIIRHLRRRR